MTMTNVDDPYVWLFFDIVYPSEVAGEDCNDCRDPYAWLFFDIAEPYELPDVLGSLAKSGSR